MVDDLTYEQLRSLARRKGTTASNMIREALARYVVAETVDSESALVGLIGMLDGPAEALGERSEAVSAEVMDDKYPARGDGGDR